MICDECDKDLDTCDRDIEDCEQDADEQAAENRFEARREARE